MLSLERPTPRALGGGLSERERLLGVGHEDAEGISVKERGRWYSCLDSGHAGPDVGPIE